MTSLLDQFVEDARSVSIEEAASRLGLVFTRKRFEHPQPCPSCGGTDTFAFNTSKNAWNCRQGGAGGRDAIGMAAHCLDLDLARRDGFLEACAAVLGQSVPDEGERESDADRVAREARIAERRRRNADEAARREADGADFREREREKARGIYRASTDLRQAHFSDGRFYLRGRGCDVPDDRWLRGAADITYWHGQDEAGRPLDIHSGPAMVAPFLAPDLTIIGCHITWIDLRNAPKLRPRLYGLTKSGEEHGLLPWTARDRQPSRDDFAAGFYEILPSKKMRGSKKGGLIPLAGHPEARRWVCAEGIENTLAFAGWEGFRADTFYCAAGDLGNLSGPADPASRFAHPTLTKADRRGVARPVMVAGPVPMVTGEADSIWIGDQVDELVLLADGDSERIMTAAAMARAKARHARPGRRTIVVWPKLGMDLAEMARQMESETD